MVAGLSYTALRVSATANDFSAALLTPMLRIVQVGERRENPQGDQWSHVE